MDLILDRLSEIGAVCGDEFRLSSYIKEKFSKEDTEIIYDESSNVIVHIKGNEGSKKLMLYTHIDEPGLVINSVDEKGFLKFDIIGGINPKDLAAQEVYVYGKDKTLGVIGLRPPHVLSDEERKAPVTMDELNIDVGLPRDRALQSISPGDTAAVKRKYMKLKDSMACGKALCDRAGTAILYELFKSMKDVKMDIYFAFGVQHYNNCAGALAVTMRIKPDMAIVLDSMEAKSRENNSITQGLGMGPVIYMGPTAHPDLTQDLLKYARSESLEYQVMASSNTNPTDAWTIQVTCGGVPLMLVMSPVRYRYSSVEIMDTGDIFKTARLLNGYIRYLDDVDWGELLCY